MLDITTFEKHALAIELLRRHALIAIIHKVTGIPTKVLRVTYKAMHGRSSRSGQPKQSSRGLTRTRKAYQEATQFAVYFKTVNAKSQDDQARKVIMAFDLYKAALPESRLNFSGMWVISKELKAGIINLIKCGCGAAVLLNAKDDLDDRCLVCGMRY